MTEKKKSISIWPDEVKTYAASAALEEARRKGWLTLEQIESITSRANAFMQALSTGMVLRPTDTGYDIIDRETALAEDGIGAEDDDNLVIEN